MIAGSSKRQLLFPRYVTNALLCVDVNSLMYLVGQPAIGRYPINNEMELAS